MLNFLLGEQSKIIEEETINDSGSLRSQGRKLIKTLKHQSKTLQSKISNENLRIVFLEKYLIRIYHLFVLIEYVQNHALFHSFIFFNTDE